MSFASSRVRPLQQSLLIKTKIYNSWPNSTGSQFALPATVVACPTTIGTIQPAVGTGVLKLGNFKRFLELSPEIREVEFSNFGEIFLNPELQEILYLDPSRFAPNWWQRLFRTCRFWARKPLLARS